MNELKQRFQSLTERERVVLSAGIICTILIILYAFVWEPWQEELNRLRAQVPIKQETLVWMQKQADQVRPLLQKEAIAKQLDNQPLLTVIEGSAQRSGLSKYIRRMAPGENGHVQIWLTDVEFDKWITWLEQLRTLSIEVNTASVNRVKDNRVTVRVTLQR